jgi:ABC-2 type transport system permease protein
VPLEKTTRISEVLLSVLRPSQVLTGTVLGVGAVTLVQLLVLGLPLAVALRTGLDLGIPAVAASDIALGLVWFLLGFALYAFVYAACGAVVQKVADVGTAVTPVALVMVAGYMLSIIVVMDDPGSVGSLLVSMVPFTAPIGMPMRWAGMEVPVWQLLTAMALTGMTAVAVAAFASRVYRRALLITDRRVKARDVISAGG